MTTHNWYYQRLAAMRKPCRGLKIALTFNHLNATQRPVKKRKSSWILTLQEDGTAGELLDAQDIFYYRIMPHG